MKAAGWSTRNSVLDASLSYVYNGISGGSKISTGRQLSHPRNQHDPTGSKPSAAGLAAEAIPVFIVYTKCGIQGPNVPVCKPTKVYISECQVSQEIWYNFI
jgi:hypothetical protein